MSGAYPRPELSEADKEKLKRIYDDLLDLTLSEVPSVAAAATAALAQVATALSGALPAQAQNPPPAKEASSHPGLGAEGFLTLTATEAAFLSAAYDTFIPADRLSPSGTDCGLVVFMDRQLAGAWGGGARLYRGGPFIQGKREQGYQLS